MIRSIRVLLFLLLPILAVSCAAKTPSREAAVAEVTAALNDPNPAVQIPALLKLSEFGQEGATAAPLVLERLKSKDKNVRRYAALALVRVARPAEAVPALTAALRDPDRDVRQQAAMALGELGPEARAALPELEKLSKDPDPCASVASAINRIRQ